MKIPFLDKEGLLNGLAIRDMNSFKEIPLPKISREALKGIEVDQMIFHQKENAKEIWETFLTLKSQLKSQSILFERQEYEKLILTGVKLGTPLYFIAKVDFEQKDSSLRLATKFYSSVEQLYSLIENKKSKYSCRFWMCFGVALFAGLILSWNLHKCLKERRLRRLLWKQGNDAVRLWH